MLSKYKKQKKMDMQKPLKFEGEYFGIETDSDFNDCFKENFLQDSYDRCFESSHLNTGCDMSSHIIDQIKAHANIALTPMAQLLQLGRRESGWSKESDGKLRRKLWKTKLIQKRDRAKNRKIQRNQTESEASKVFDVISVDTSEDIKKQKNRLSAQISRDRKKQHYSKLQLQNSELRKTINQLNRTNNELQRKMAHELEDQQKRKGENLFKSLLILLGIIFLVNLIKRTSGIKSQRALDKFPISKIELSKQEKNFLHSEMKSIGVEIPYEMTQRSKNEIYIDKHLGNQLLEIKLGLV